MISMLRGVLVHKDFEGIVIDVGGVGYRVGMPMTSLERLPPLGEEAKVFTWMSVREDDISLFGFGSTADRAVFDKLLKVSGVGPKVALSILSGMTAREVVTTIAGGNVRALCDVKGIGKKIAERLVVELKDSITKIDLSDGLPSVTSAGASVAAKADMQLEDLRSALLNLGYPPPSVDKAIENLRQGEVLDFDAMLRAALKFMRGAR